MKKFTRFAALLLALLLAMSLAACGKKTDGGDPDPAPAKEFSAGKVDGSTYTNEYFGFSVSLTEDFGWTYFTDEQIAQVTGQTADILDSDKITEAYDSGKVIMEMYAMRDDYASVNIAVEKLGKVNGALLDEEGYVDASLNSLPEQLLTAGYTDVDAAKTTVSFAGAEHDGRDLEHTGADDAVGRAAELEDLRRAARRLLAGRRRAEDERRILRLLPRRQERMEHERGLFPADSRNVAEAPHGVGSADKLVHFSGNDLLRLSQRQTAVKNDRSILRDRVIGGGRAVGVGQGNGAVLARLGAERLVQLLYARDDLLHQVYRIAAFFRAARMAAHAGHFDLDQGPPAVPDCHAQACRLTEDHAAGPQAGLAEQILERIAVVVLFHGAGGDIDRRVRRNEPCLFCSRRAVDGSGQTAFHIRRAASADVSVADLAAVGREGPFRLVIDGDGIHMRI